MYLPKIAESEFHIALSEALDGRAIELSGQGLSPIEILEEPTIGENPLPMTLRMTEPVKPGLTEEQIVGESASYEIVLVDELINITEVTKKDAERKEPGNTLHIAEESEFHLDDSHEHPEKVIACVEEKMPKYKPMTDKTTEPVLAALKNWGELTCGGENDSDKDALLRKAPTETFVENINPLPEVNLQTRTLLEIQRAASEIELPRRPLAEKPDTPNLLPNTEIEDPPVPGMIKWVAVEIDGISKETWVVKEPTERELVADNGRRHDTPDAILETMELSHIQRVELADVPLTREPCETAAIPYDTPNWVIEIEPVEAWTKESLSFSEITVGES